MTEAHKTILRPAIIGETLFDRFPEGVQVLGGAPFNVAWHLQGFGAAPLLISRIGDDASGRKVLDAIGRWGMDSSGLMVDGDYPTGAVDISFEKNQHRFEILPDQAYDNISRSQLSACLKPHVGLIYLGTLIMRSPPMRDRLIEFLQSREKPLFVDLNVRTPWWRAEDMPHLLQRATWLKLNETELQILADELNCSGQSVEDSATRILNLSEIELLILTLGSAGALAFADGSEPLSVAPEISVKTVDTVGAGDAFAAVTILGLLSDWPLDVVMHRAQEFSSQIVQQRGATAENRDLYDQTLQGWETN